jgi:predicted nucleotidyltransferase
MRKAEILKRLAHLKPWLASRGVRRIRLFGSHARDTAGPDSDVDLIVDLERPLGLAFFDLQDELAQKLGAKVEMVTEAALAPDIKYTALRDAVDA